MVLESQLPHQNRQLVVLIGDSVPRGVARWVEGRECDGGDPLGF